MIEVNPWFLMLVAGWALWGMIQTMLTAVRYIFRHNKPSKLPPPPSKIIRP